MFRGEAIEGRKAVEKELMTKEQEFAELHVTAETMRIATEPVVQEPTNVLSPLDSDQTTSPAGDNKLEDSDIDHEEAADLTRLVLSPPFRNSSKLFRKECARAVFASIH
jgi:hypothetical protein